MSCQVFTQGKKPAYLQTLTTNEGLQLSDTQLLTRHVQHGNNEGVVYCWLNVFHREVALAAFIHDATCFIGDLVTGVYGGFVSFCLQRYVGHPGTFTAIESRSSECRRPYCRSPATHVCVVHITVVSTRAHSAQ